MPNFVKTNLYADDTALTVSSRVPEELEQKLNVTLDHVVSWFNQNKLSINLKKSNVMIFCTPQAKTKFGSITVKHGNIDLDSKTKTKYLGVILDPSLKFDAHVAYIKSKTIGKLKLLGWVRGAINKDTAELLYKSLIPPMFDYADVIYHCLSQRDTLTLQNLQNMGIKSILQVDRLTSTAEIHEHMNMPYLADRRDINAAAEMFKVDKGLAPRNVSSMFEKLNHSNMRNTRQATKGDYKMPHCRLEYGKRNFRYRGPKIWAKVPVDIRQSDTTKCFKKNLKKAWSGKFPNSIT